MQSSDIPVKFPLAWGANAGGGFIRPIPEDSQIGIEAGAASLNDGFPPVTFDPVGAGGVPPFGQDMNGILNEITANDQWTQAGGQPVYDATFALAIGGYPAGAILQSSDKTGFWRSTAEDNATNPDAGSATLTASIATTVLTVTAATGTLLQGQIVTGSGVTANTVILEQLTGAAGGTGTYSINNSQTITSRSMTAAGASNWVATGAATNNLVINGGTSGGTAAVQTATCSPTVTSLVTNMLVDLIFGFDCPGACTLKLDSTTAKSIKKWSAGALADPAADDFKSGQAGQVLYDGTYFILNMGIPFTVTGAALARGKLWVGNSSGAAAQAGPGTTGQALVSDGTDQTMQDVVQPGVTKNLTVGYTDAVYDLGSASGGAKTLAIANGNDQKITVDANVTINAPSTGEGWIVVACTLSGAGYSPTFSGFSATLLPNSMDWDTTSGAINYVLVKRQGSTTYYGVYNYVP